VYHLPVTYLRALTRALLPYCSRKLGLHRAAARAEPSRTVPHGSLETFIRVFRKNCSSSLLWLYLPGALRCAPRPASQRFYQPHPPSSLPSSWGRRRDRIRAPAIIHRREFHRIDHIVESRTPDAIFTACHAHTCARTMLIEYAFACCDLRAPRFVADSRLC